MPQKRRAFLKTTTLGLGALSAGTAYSCQGQNPPTNLVTKPIIISTWDHGMAANKVGLDILKNNGTALDAVEKGVIIVENDPKVQTVGLGGFPDREGVVTLDACIMKGDGQCGSVAFLRDIKNPIAVARKVMEETPHIMIVGAGAKQFALEMGFKEENLLTEPSRKKYEEWLKTGIYKPKINIENHDTISTLALDTHGHLAGACTTSGAAWKMHGRVGDSPLIAAGLFVDDEVGAAAATGLGEAVIRTAGSAMVVEAMRHGQSPEEACRSVCLRIKAKHKDISDLQVGFIALRKDGAYGAYSLQPGFTYALGLDDTHELYPATSMF